MNSLQVGGPAEENALLSTPAGADISMQAHDREWTTLEGHMRAVTSLAYTIDGMYMLSGAFNALYPHCSCLQICMMTAAHHLCFMRSMGVLSYKMSFNASIHFVVRGVQCSTTTAYRRGNPCSWCLQFKAVRCSFLR